MRSSTGRSLMPEGFERSRLTGCAICHLDLRRRRTVRILDLTHAFTANTSRGLFNSEDAKDERSGSGNPVRSRSATSRRDHESGQSPTGRNIVVLKGGNGFSRTLPQRVEAKAGFGRRQLHSSAASPAGRIPCCGDNKNQGLPWRK